LAKTTLLASIDGNVSSHQSPGIVIALQSFYSSKLLGSYFYGQSICPLFHQVGGAALAKADA
jgi:hypothetical protein